MNTGKILQEINSWKQKKVTKKQAILIFFILGLILFIYSIYVFRFYIIYFIRVPKILINNGDFEQYPYKFLDGVWKTEIKNIDIEFKNNMYFIIEKGKINVRYGFKIKKVNLREKKIEIVVDGCVNYNVLKFDETYNTIIIESISENQSIWPNSKIWHRKNFGVKIQ